ncbi:MAG: tripartite tricarboxylate transporter substrate-binding protein, partial [Candidatus Binatia bacterium]
MKRLALVVSLLSLWGAPVSAQKFPTKVITMIVPFTAGGPTDTVARLVAAPMSKVLKQQVIVENVSGAGGTIAGARVAKADPDGYTILIHHIGMSTAPTLYRKLRYKPLEDFGPIGLINEVPMTLVARRNFPPNNL